MNVTFAPTVPGQRLGAVQLVGTAGAVAGTGPIAGVGTGPYITFPNGQTPVVVATIPAPARSSALPAYGITTDGQGNVFFGDPVNGGLKKAVATNGVLPANAPLVSLGSGIVSASMLTVDGAGNIFVTDTGDESVKEIVAVNGVVSASSQVVTLTSGYTQLSGIVADGSGNVFFTDYKQAVIFEIQGVQGVVSPSSPVRLVYSNIFFGPTSLAVDASGNLYVGDTDTKDRNEILELFAVNGVVTQTSNFKDYGGADPIGYSTLTDFALDAAGDIYQISFNYIDVLPNGGSSGGNGYTGILGSNINLSAFALTPQGQAYATQPTTDGHLQILGVDTRTPPSVTLALPAPAAPGSSSEGFLSLLNTGNAALSLPAPAMGTNPTPSTGFGLGTDTCPQPSAGGTAGTLGAGFLCRTTITFQASGSARVATGDLVFTDNDVNAASATQSIPLLAPITYPLSIDVSNVFLTFGTGPTSLTATVTFGGGTPAGPLTFALDGATLGNATCTTTSSTAQTCTLSFDSSKLTVGEHTVTATEAADTNYLQTSSTQTNNLKVVPALSALPPDGSVSFPDTLFGTSSTPVSAMLTLTSAGTIGAPEVLTLGAPNLDYKDAGTGTCTTNGTTHVYAVGDTCTVNLIFTPTAVGGRPGAVVLASSTGSTVAQATLVGSGTAPLVTYPTQSNLTPLATLTDAGSSAYTQFLGMVIDGKGDLIFDDSYLGTIRMLPATNGSIAPNAAPTTLVGGFTTPAGLAIDGAGNLYVADSRTGILSEVVAQNGVISSSSPVLVLTDDYFLYGAVGVDSHGNVFFNASDSNGYNVQLYEIAAVNGQAPAVGTVTLIGPDSTYATNIRTDAQGNVYLAGVEGVVEYNATNGSVSAGATTTTFDDYGVKPFDLFAEPSGNLLVSGLDDLFEYTSTASYGINELLDYMQPLDSAFVLVAGNGRGQLYLAENNGSSLSFSVLDQRSPVPTYAFPLTAIGSTSATQRPTLENNGNLPLTLTAPSSGANGTLSAGFTAPSGNYYCLLSSTPGSAQTVPPRDSCFADVGFAPVAGQSGTVTGSLIVTDNDLNAAAATQTFALTGVVDPGPNTIATATTISVTPTTGTTATEVTFAATVTSNVNSPVNGTITFYDNGTAISGATAIPVGNGTFAGYPYAQFTAGTHPITATYTPPSGSAFKSSTSSTVNSTITAPLQASIILTNLTQVYAAGALRSPGVVTQPLGLTYQLTFTTLGAAHYPTNAGSYPFTVTITDPNYTGSASGTLVIQPASATVMLSNLTAAYDGNPHAATVTTSPAGLATSITYNGSATAPTAAGSYTVVATVTNANYTGSATGTLVITGTT